MANRIRLEVQGEWVIIGEMLYRTEDQRIVHENDTDGRWLAFTPGTRIRREEAERLGLLKPENEPEENKARSPRGKKA